MWRRPAASDGRVFFGSNDHDVYALRASDGGVLWRFQTRDSVNSVPMVAPGVVYVGSNNGTEYALKASDGSLLWSHQTGGRISTTPALAQGIVYVGGTDGTLYALQAQSGQLVWKFATGGSWVGTATVADGIVYVPTIFDPAGHVPDAYPGTLYALSAADGGLQWRYFVPNFALDAPGVATSSLPSAVAVALHVERALICESAFPTE